MRVRCFSQDDAHIFMMPEQIRDEIKGVARLIDEVYSLFGFRYHVELSTRPEDSMGSDEDWEMATDGLRGALDDLGVSYVPKQDVFKTFAERLPATLKLACSSVLVATLVGLPLGIYTAIHQNTWKDTGGMVFALFGVSMPNFWLGLMLILVFSLGLKWFPSGGYGGIRNLVLPAVTVGLGFAALITRTTRSAMLDVIRQDYMTTARAKGVPERKVIFGHALKNALIPIITVIGMQLSNALTGSVLAETVFSWPGVGRLIVDSIAKRDTPMVTGSIIMCCILVCIVIVAVDLIYAFFDPRIKAQYSRKG